MTRYLKYNYSFFAKYLEYLVLEKNAKDQVILVYTMGKAGSTTVSHTLEKELNEYSVYDIHWLNKRNLDLDKRFHERYYNKNKEIGIDLNILPKYITRGYYLHSRLLNHQNRKIKIYTIARDPVAKEVSSFFQNLKRFFGYDFGRREDLGEENVVDELIDLFLNGYITKNGINFFDANPLSWFDEEIKEVFDIDVYEEAFPKERGYKIYTKNNLSLLLVRLEDLNRCFTEGSEKLLGETIKISESKNVGDKKEYASIYDKFKQRIEFPEWYLNRMYESKYANHFYTDDEIMAFRSKWTKNFQNEKIVSPEY